MAIPHETQIHIIKKRIKGKEGKEKAKEIEEILKELPGYNNGHYGKIKKWLNQQVDNLRKKSKIVHNDFFTFKKEGDRQIALVGCPSVGKSSLLKKLTGLQTKVADYEFTTLKPIPGILEINHARFQIIDLPGLIEGASEDAGKGKRFLSIVKSSDAIILMHDLTKEITNVRKILQELEKAKINDKKIIVIGSKIDLNRNNLKELKKEFKNHPVIGISVTEGEGLEQLKKEIWKSSELIRAYPFGMDTPVILQKNSDVKEFMNKIHTDLVKRFKYAKITGMSVKFSKQRVNKEHKLMDKDIIELVLER